MALWKPPIEPSKQEQLLLKRLVRTRKLFGFLRRQRHRLFDEAFQLELLAMYRDSGAGSPPIEPAKLCAAVLLQAYLGISDAEAVEMTVVDLRWQMVLDHLRQDAPAFAQGTLQSFRQRLIDHDMDRRLLERTVELAKETKEFDWKKLPKGLRVAVDARPFEGAGRVEDTLNMLGHAARKMVAISAKRLDGSVEAVCEAAMTPLFGGSSLKAALDIDWNSLEQREAALDELTRQVCSLVTWITDKDLLGDEELAFYLTAAAQVWSQNLELDKGMFRVAQDVAPERRISIEDADMRHGRKSKSKTVSGYKEHLAGDLDNDLVLAAAVTPANRPEGEAADPILRDLGMQSLDTAMAELYVDRAYSDGLLAIRTLETGGQVYSRSRSSGRSNGGRFPKTAFQIDIDQRTATCPKGVQSPIQIGQEACFPASTCNACDFKPKCTPSDRGRRLAIAHDEPLQAVLRAAEVTRAGRAKLRRRVGIEHMLAHVAAKKGPRARYRGLRKNVFDTRRTAAIYNLESIQRRILRANSDSSRSAL